ncbi:hypothetical protein HanRHA438_Chr10g0464591 [Helianthus annuus]|nr:hypothetical protein HanRHA438_Chr10g0464591 [Helianthus annuus]
MASRHLFFLNLESDFWNPTTVMKSSLCVKKNKEEECRTEDETVRSRSSRRSRAAAVHKHSERTDKASMLDEVTNSFI